MFIWKIRALAACAAVLAGAAFFTPAANADYAMTHNDCALLGKTTTILNRILAGKTPEEREKINKDVGSGLATYAALIENPIEKRALALGLSRAIAHFATTGTQEIATCSQKLGLVTWGKSFGSSISWEPIDGTRWYDVRVYDNFNYGRPVYSARTTDARLDLGKKGINSGYYDVWVWGEPGAGSEDIWKCNPPALRFKTDVTTELDDGQVDWATYGNGVISWDPGDNVVSYDVVVWKNDEWVMEDSVSAPETSLPVEFIREFGGQYEVTVTPDMIGSGEKWKISAPITAKSIEVRGTKIKLPFRTMESVSVSTADDDELTDDLLRSRMDKDGFYDLQPILKNAELSGEHELIAKFKIGELVLRTVPFVINSAP